MTKSWEKFAKKSPYRFEIEKILQDIQNDNLALYDVIKIQGREGYFRLRKGKIRIIFTKRADGNYIELLNNRGDVYKGL